MRFSRFFITRPIFAGSDRGDHHRGRCAGLFRPADLAISGNRAAHGHGDRRPTRRLRRDGGRDHRRADRTGDQRGRQHALYVVAVDRRRQARHHRHLQDRHQSRCRAGAGAKPRRGGRAAPARRGAAARRGDTQDLAGLPDGREPAVARRHVRSQLPVELRPHPSARPPGADRRRRRCRAVRLARLRDADLDRPGPGRRAQPDGRRDRRGVARAECPGRRGRNRPAALCDRPKLAMPFRSGSKRKAG